MVCYDSELSAKLAFKNGSVDLKKLIVFKDIVKYLVPEVELEPLKMLFD